MNPPTTPALGRQFRRIVTQSDHLIAILDGAGPAIDARQQRVSAWNVAQHLEHLGITGSLTLDTIDSLLGGNGHPQGSPSTMGRLVLLSGRIPRGRGKARPEWFPGDGGREAARQRLEAYRLRLPALEADLPRIADSRQASRHAVLGYFNARQWLRFLAIHQQHHLRIIADIGRAVARS